MHKLKKPCDSSRFNLIHPHGLQDEFDDGRTVRVATRGRGSRSSLRTNTRFRLL